MVSEEIAYRVEAFWYVLANQSTLNHNLILNEDRH